MSHQLTQNQQNINILEIMTSALKSYKFILNQLQHQYSNRFHCLYSSQTSTKLQKIQEIVSNLTKISTTIQQHNLNKILGNRFMNRLIQTTTIYKRKYIQGQAFFQLKQQINLIFQIMKQSQNGINQFFSIHNQIENQFSKTNLQHIKKYQFAILFDKICWIFKKSLKDLRQNYYQTHLATTLPLDLNKNLLQSFPSQQQTITHSFSQTKDNNVPIKQRKNSINNQTPIIKSLQYKYKLTKQIVGNISLLSGMNIDMTHFRGLFFQARNNIGNVYEDRISFNQTILKQRQKYLGKYTDWKSKIRAKKIKKQKSEQLSPNKLKLIEYKTCTSNQTLNPLQRIPKIRPSSPPQTSFQHLSQQDKPAPLPIKQLAALALNKQNIHLNQIKNQKIAKRPYTQVKQVLVTGDQLNYYSNKNTYIECTFTHYHHKTNFFMQRALKNQKIYPKKKFMPNPKIFLKHLS